MPWNGITLVVSHSNTMTVKVPDIAKFLRNQADPNGRGFNKETTGDGRFIIQFRLQHIQSWNLTGRVISLSIDDYLDTIADSGARDQLCGLVDTGNSTHTPAVGFRLSSAHQSAVLRNDDKYSEMILLTVSAPKGDQCITYIKMLWRFDGPAVHPTLSSIEHTIQTVADTITKHIDDSKPTIVSRVVDGVSAAASVVAVASGGVTDTIESLTSRLALLEARLDERDIMSIPSSEE